MPLWELTPWILESFLGLPLTLLISNHSDNGCRGRYWCNLSLEYIFCHSHIYQLNWNYSGITKKSVYDFFIIYLNTFLKDTLSFNLFTKWVVKLFQLCLMKLFNLFTTDLNRVDTKGCIQVHRFFFSWSFLIICKHPPSLWWLTSLEVFS